MRLLFSRNKRNAAAHVQTRLNELPLQQPVTVEPMKRVPLIKDLVTDVSWNFRVKKQIKKFNPRKPDTPEGTWRMFQEDVDRVQEFRKCIECFLCQDVCHVLREHHLHEEFVGPRTPSCSPQRSKCIHSTQKTGSGNSRRRKGSVIATSRNVAQRFVLKTLRSRTTR